MGFWKEGERYLTPSDPVDGGFFIVYSLWKNIDNSEEEFMNVHKNKPKTAPVSSIWKTSKQKAEQQQFYNQN